VLPPIAIQFASRAFLMGDPVIALLAGRVEEGVGGATRISVYSD
jgi:hypothetical protein